MALEGLYASGDDLSTPDESEAWNQLFPTAHKFLGLMDVFGARANAISGVLHLSAKATKALTSKLDGHVFAWPQANMAGVDGYVGSEVNLIALYSLGKGLGMRALYGIFLPDKDAFPMDDPAHYLEIELAYHLK